MNNAGVNLTNCVVRNKLCNKKKLCLKKPMDCIWNILQYMLQYMLQYVYIKY